MLSYQLKRRRGTTRISLRLTPQGEVVVAAPYLVPQFLIDGFVKKNEPWLMTKIKLLRAKAEKSAQQFVIFGKSYELKFIYEQDLKSGWQIVDGQLIYNNSQYLFKPKTTTRLTKAEKEKLEKFARETIHAYIAKRVPKLKEKMKLRKKLGRICIKNQASRWGSCSSIGNLNFNYNLIHYAPAVIDYVLIHELAHLVHLDHSAKFWALVAKYDGAYKRHRKILNES